MHVFVSVRPLSKAAFIFTKSCVVACLSLWLIPVTVGCMQDGSGGGWTTPAMFASHDASEPAEEQGEAWTILCVEAMDHRRVANCDNLARALRQFKQLDGKQVRLEHGDRASQILYGTYYRRVDPTTGREGFGEEVLRDLEIIRNLASGNAYPFSGARVVPKPTPDPGRSEWHLSRCPTDYTLQIGVFYNTPTFGSRKRAAVDWVEKLRDEGIEAYYHHGEVRSSVCVGHFTAKDVIRKQVGPKNVTLNTVIRYSDRVEALRKQERFAYNLENGHKVKKIRQTPQGFREVYLESFLLHVPKRSSSPVRNDLPTGPMSTSTGG